MAVERDLDVGMRCVKYMLFVANFMFVLVGFLLISIGTTIKAIYTDFDEFMESHYYSPSTLAIAIGIIIFFIAILGCIGAVKKSTFLVNTYAFLLSCVLILEVAVCIAAYAMRSNIEENIEANMEIAMENYEDYYAGYTWNATQYNLRCCGVNDPSDWNQYANNSEYYLTKVVLSDENGTVLYVPETCCWNETCTDGYVYSDGCLSRLAFIVSESALLLAVGAMCVSFIQVLGIVFAHMLAKSIRKLKTQILVENEKMRQHFYEQLAKENVEKPTPVLYTPASSEA